MDTVPWQENREQWQDHPLAGALRDGRIYGRGSVDAKGQVMAALGAVLALADLGFCPHGDVIVESVVSEEPDGNGTLALCSEGWLADAAIVLEPTDCQVCYGHRGIVGLRYTVTGHAGHAALGRPRNSAIVTAARFAIALDRALEDWSAPGDGAYGAPVLNVGRIVGGESIFTVAPLCEIECGVRYAPGAYDAVLQHIKDRVAHEAKAATISQVDMRVFSHYDAMSTSPQGPLASGLLTCVQRVRPDRKLTTFPAGCDARHFTNRFGIPAVIFGPGQLNTAHAVDENLPLEDWLLAIQALAAFIVEWCG
jgi:acetylornithine deacetylase